MVNNSYLYFKQLYLFLKATDFLYQPFTKISPTLQLSTDSTVIGIDRKLSKLLLKKNNKEEEETFTLRSKLLEDMYYYDTENHWWFSCTRPWEDANQIVRTLEEQSVRKKHQAALFPLKIRKKAEDPFVRRDYVCRPYCCPTPHKKPQSNHLVSTDLSAVDSPDC